MATENEFSSILSAVKNWKETSEGNPQLSSGLMRGNVAWGITRTQYEQYLKGQGDTFHVYLGQVSNELQMVFIGEAQDANEITPGTLMFMNAGAVGVDLDYFNFVSEAEAGDITVNEGLKRTFNWSLFANEAVMNLSQEEELVRVFRANMDDLVDIFEDPEVNDAIVMFGLGDLEGHSNNYQIDLIFWGISANGAKVSPRLKVEDITLPMPPYQVTSNYQLYHQVNSERVETV